MTRVLELFAGIGACSKALENLGVECEIVDAVEIDKYAIRSFNAIHGTRFEPQDITQWNKEWYCPCCHKILGSSEVALHSEDFGWHCRHCSSLVYSSQIDLITHGSPCQDFSVAGLQKGGDEGSGTRSSLMYETIRIVSKLRPKYVLWENVKNILSKKHVHNFHAYLEATEGDSVNLAYPESKTRRGRVGHSVCQALTTGNSMGVVDSSLRVRKLTPRECWRLMGFSDEDFDKAAAVNSNTQLYKQAGNSIVVNVVEAIFRNML